MKEAKRERETERDGERDRKRDRESRDVFAQVMVHCPHPQFSLSPSEGPVSPPSVPPLQAFISLHGLGSDVLFPAFRQERERRGAREKEAFSGCRRAVGRGNLS